MSAIERPVDSDPVVICVVTCAECRRTIGKSGYHRLLGPEPYDPGRVLCINCSRRGSWRPTAQELHAKYYPDCPYEWHDLYDHRSVHSYGRRGAVAVLNRQLST